MCSHSMSFLNLGGEEYVCVRDLGDGRAHGRVELMIRTGRAPMEWMLMTLWLVKLICLFWVRNR